MFKLLELKSDIKEKPNAPQLLLTQSDDTGITFENVTFTYPNSSKILDDISFR